MLSDPNHRFHQIWTPGGWTVRHRGEPGCWGRNGAGWFRNAFRGEWCGRNWYIGNAGGLGGFNGGPDKDWVSPRFWRPAPAVLGFDESIDSYCAAHGGSGRHAEACVNANVNILSIQDGSYNTCKNLEWQVCAARGWLPGQMSSEIRFAFRPAELNPDFIGACTGYHPAGCGDQGYASYDIFFLEVCMYSTICANGAELFSEDMQIGTIFRCQLDEARYNQLRDWILASA